MAPGQEALHSSTSHCLRMAILKQKYLLYPWCSIFCWQRSHWVCWRLAGTRCWARFRRRPCSWTRLLLWRWEGRYWIAPSIKYKYITFQSWTTPPHLAHYIFIFLNMNNTPSLPGLASYKTQCHHSSGNWLAYQEGLETVRLIEFTSNRSIEQNFKINIGQ